MRTHPDALKLVNHAYGRSTSWLLRGNERVDPLGPASMLLRHFDVRLAEDGQTGTGDGRVEGRTLWVSPALVSGWIGRHQANRERRANGWVRLTEATQAFLVQMVLTAMRGFPLDDADLFSLQSALARTPYGARLAPEMKRLYRIQVATVPAFYAQGEPGVVLATLQALEQPLPPLWLALLESSWKALGWSDAMIGRALPSAVPDQDLTVAQRARLITFSVRTPDIPPPGPHTSEEEVVTGFLRAIAPVLEARPLPPPFLFESLAHGYLQALKAAAGQHPLRTLFDESGRPLASTRFGCVMAAMEALSPLAEEPSLYEGALLAGLCNLDRQD